MKAENGRLRAEAERVTCELMDATARADGLAEALRSYAEALERLAFAIPAPNTHTPQLVELAIAMRAAAQGERAMYGALKQGPSPHIGDENGGHRLVEPDQETALALADAPRSLRNYVAALQAEIEQLRAKAAVAMGVGTGDGNLFVHGDYASIKAAQAIVLQQGALRAEVDALARENEALRRCAIKYLGWLNVTHKPLDVALREDTANPDMCGEAALAQEDRND